MAQQKQWQGLLLKMAVIVAVGALLTIFLFTEKYVIGNKAQQKGPLVIENVPTWVTEALLEEVWTAAGARTFPLHKDTIRLLADNLSTVPWLDQVQIWMTDKEVRAKAYWQKPLARVNLQPNPFYVSAQGMVLEAIPLPALSIVTIKGVSFLATPTPGETLTVTSLKAALALLVFMEQMDRRAVPDRPLMAEIDYIDMTNFQGHHNSNKPHISLYAKDGTQIIWGVEIGAWDKHLEARDDEKLAKLYAYYAETGSVMGGARYIDLREPQNELPLPIDKYAP